MVTNNNSDRFFCKEKGIVYLIFCQNIITEAFGLYLHHFLKKEKNKRNVFEKLILTVQEILY